MRGFYRTRIWTSPDLPTLWLENAWDSGLVTYKVGMWETIPFPGKLVKLNWFTEMSFTAFSKKINVFLRLQNVMKISKTLYISASCVLVKRVVVFLILIYKTITWHEKPVLHILTTNCTFRILDLHTLDVTHGSLTVFYTDIKGRFMKLGDCLHGNQVRSSHKISKIIIILHKTLSGETFSN